MHAFVESHGADLPHERRLQRAAAQEYQRGARNVLHRPGQEPAAAVFLDVSLMQHQRAIGRHAEHLPQAVRARHPLQGRYIVKDDRILDGVRRGQVRGDALAYGKHRVGVMDVPAFDGFPEPGYPRPAGRGGHERIPLPGVVDEPGTRPLPGEPAHGRQRVQIARMIHTGRHGRAGVPEHPVDAPEKHRPTTYRPDQHTAADAVV